MIGGITLNTPAGVYYLGVMAPGNYTLTAMATGYSPSSYPNVLLPGGDGIQDGTESGITAPVVDPDGGGPLLGTNGSVFIPDSDPGTTTDPLDEDSDNDGQTDGQEDKDHNGRVDAGENDPNQSDMKAMPWIPLLLLYP